MPLFLLLILILFFLFLIKNMSSQPVKAWTEESFKVFNTVFLTTKSNKRFYLRCSRKQTLFPTFEHPQGAYLAGH